MKKAYTLAGYIFMWLMVTTDINAQQIPTTDKGNFSSPSQTTYPAVEKTANNTLLATQKTIQPLETQKTIANTIQTLVVSPNPVNKQLTIHAQLIKLQQAIYKLYDISGKLLEKQAIVKTSTSIDFSKRHAGIYILTVTNNDTPVGTFKIIKL